MRWGVGGRGEKDSRSPNPSARHPLPLLHHRERKERKKEKKNKKKQPTMPRWPRKTRRVRADRKHLPVLCRSYLFQSNCSSELVRGLKTNWSRERLLPPESTGCVVSMWREKGKSGETIIITVVIVTSAVFRENISSYN